MGTGEIGVRLLRALNKQKDLELTLVVTGPDKPAGRKMLLQPSLIKQTALELGIEVFQPDDINKKESIERLSSVSPEVILVMAYGQLLKSVLLEMPPIDCLNVHTSLLPKYRGASPIQSAILNGDKITGVTLMKMVQKMDAGPVYVQFEQVIDPNDTTLSLSEKLAELSAEKIPQAIIDIAKGKFHARDQKEAEVTHVQKISKQDGEINWDEDAESIGRKIRAFHPWPSAYTFFKGKRLKIFQAKTHQVTRNEPPGTVVKMNEIVGVVAKNGLIELMEVQMEGKKAQSIKGFLNGNQDFMGTCLD